LFARFPSICHFLATYGLDPSRDQIPVAPAAHYMIGGVSTDLEGRSSLAGLYAAGEVASTGVHGANRLAGNSLLEGLVFGERVARQLLHPATGGPKLPERIVEVALPTGGSRPEEPEEFDQVRNMLWDQVGIVRSADGMRSALDRFDRLTRSLLPSRANALAGPVANAACTAMLITRAASTRTESRGAHYRSDWPQRRANWRIHIGLRLRAPSGRAG
jgi:L-aspartate oxidase